MRLSLCSDFHDYYDHAFDSGNADATYHRMSTGGMSRPEMLSYLESEHRLRVPFHGTVLALRARLECELDYLGSAALIHDFMSTLMDVVVYIDPMAHAGQGKVKMNILDAVAQYPEHYATQYIPSNASGLGDSLRYLRLGRRQFWMRYWSTSDWRSNAGDVHIKVLSEERAKPYSELCKYDVSIFAIDFVRADFLFAIDFNIAPGLSKTGIEGFITPTEIFEEIKAWFSHNEQLNAAVPELKVVNG
jgi:hypothetical protein